MTLLCSDFMDEDGLVVREVAMTRVRVFAATAEPVPWYELVSIEQNRRYVLFEGPLEMLRDFTFQTPFVLRPGHLLRVRAGETVESRVRFVFEGHSLDRSTGAVYGGTPPVDHPALRDMLRIRPPNIPVPVDPPAPARVSRRIRLKGGKT